MSYNVERNAGFIKERCYHSIPFLWILTSVILSMKQTVFQFVTVYYCQTLCASANSLSGCIVEKKLIHRPVLKIKPNIQ